jgi:triacylglycerol esterase/lipase EstA (alpha/beta hydrolase family)
MRKYPRTIRDKLCSLTEVASSVMHSLVTMTTSHNCNKILPANGFFGGWQNARHLEKSPWVQIYSYTSCTGHAALLRDRRQGAGPQC